MAFVPSGKNAASGGTSLRRSGRRPSRVPRLCVAHAVAARSSFPTATPRRTLRLRVAACAHRFVRDDSFHPRMRPLDGRSHDGRLSHCQPHRHDSTLFGLRLRMRGHGVPVADQERSIPRPSLPRLPQRDRTPTPTIRPATRFAEHNQPNSVRTVISSRCRVGRRHRDSAGWSQGDGGLVV